MIYSRTVFSTDNIRYILIDQVIRLRFLNKQYYIKLGMYNVHIIGNFDVSARHPFRHAGIRRRYLMMKLCTNIYNMWVAPSSDELSKIVFKQI